jgi:type IV pilus assembly protein PilM
MAGPLIGLDIGTSAVRAAQVAGGRKGAALQAFGQVALPPGAVIDGEVRDTAAVSEAISQLFKRAGLKSKKAVLGVANQRVVVRQVDLPYLEEKEFRASLRFQAADHIPMSVEDAELDFQLIEDYTNPAGDRMMRVLLVAAATDMVASFVESAAAAGIEPVGVDLTPFAVTRAVSPAARKEVGVAGAEAVVDVGAGVTNIVIHHNGEPRFVRILLVGGEDATEALASELGVSADEAEAAKLDLGRGVGTPEAQKVLATRVDSLVQEIQGSLDYYLSQEDSEPIASLIMTGGGSLTPGLIARLEDAARLQVRRGSPLSQLDVSKSGLTPEQVAQVDPVAAAAIGLAMGAATK